MATMQVTSATPGVGLVSVKVVSESGTQARLATTDGAKTGQWANMVDGDNTLALKGLGKQSGEVDLFVQFQPAGWAKTPFASEPFKVTTRDIYTMLNPSMSNEEAAVLRGHFTAFIQTLPQDVRAGARDYLNTMLTDYGHKMVADNQARIQAEAVKSAAVWDSIVE